MNVLFMGNCGLLSTGIAKCLERNIPFLALESSMPVKMDLLTSRRFHSAKHMIAERALISKYISRLDPLIITQPKKVVDWLYLKKFIPDVVINSMDNLEALELEYLINTHFKCASQFDDAFLKFSQYKSAQYEICQKLNIPIPNKTGEWLAVKRNKSHWDKNLRDSFPKLKKINSKDYVPADWEFSQEWHDTEYRINAVFYIDYYGDWTFVSSNYLPTVHSLAISTINPYLPKKKELDLILDSATKLKKYLNVKRRMIQLQFMKSRIQDNLLFMECNSRVSSETTWIRHHERSTFCPFDLMINDNSNPQNAYLFDKILHTEIIFNQYVEKLNKLPYVDYSILPETLNLNWSKQEVTPEEGAFVPIKI